MMMMAMMPTKQQLQQSLTRFSELIDEQPRPSSHTKQVDRIDLTDRTRLDFWTNPSSGTDWRKRRTIAYLSAYVQTFGPTFLANTTPTDDGGSFVPDVSVMKALLEGDCVRLSDDRSTFSLTAKGQALILPFVELESELSH